MMATSNGGLVDLEILFLKKNKQTKTKTKKPINTIYGIYSEAYSYPKMWMPSSE